MASASEMAMLGASFTSALCCLAQGRERSVLVRLVSVVMATAMVALSCWDGWALRVAAAVTLSLLGWGLLVQGPVRAKENVFRAVGVLLMAGAFASSTGMATTVSPLADAPGEHAMHASHGHASRDMVGMSTGGSSASRAPAPGPDGAFPMRTVIDVATLLYLLWTAKMLWRQRGRRDAVLGQGEHVAMSVALGLMVFGMS